jgi:hypothetical protein
VVTSQITESENPAFFVQSAEGGEYNGIYIFKYDEVEYTPAIGDIVSITGEYAEFYGNSQLKVTAPGNIEVTGTGGVVAVTDITEEPENWEAYESVVVRFTDMEITDAAKLYEWGAVELAIGCWMDNDFTNYDAEDGATYESITGPMTYSFEKYSILPRSSADLVGYTGTVGGGSGGSGGDEICDDGADNDGDGYIDCDDWDCDDDPACGGSGDGGGSSGGGSGGGGDSSESDCTDGADNDGDGFIDCDDWDCDDDPACGGSGGSGGDAEVCDDGIDNDGDGYIDCDDWDCEGDTACGGSDGGSGGDASETDCTDGEDDDGDGFIDCDDWDCDDDPACATDPEADCSDGEDDDGDSFIDCDDHDCSYDEACAEDCTDGIDNDEDGYTDCDDFYCEEDPACEGAG